MNISTRLIATVLASTLVTATPAFAQHRSSGGRGSTGGGHAARGAAVRSGSRSVASGGRVFAQSRGVVGVRGGAVGVRGGVAVASRGVYRGGVFVRSAPVRFFRPYYSFRPSFSIGFGLWAGFPIAYSAGFYAPYYPYYDPYYYGYGAPYPYYSYPYPYPYYNAYPYPYGGPAYGTPAPAYPPNAYPPSTSPVPGTTPPGTTTPPSSYPNGTPYRSPSRTISVDAQRNLGGFSFEVSPNTAQVLVDGKYMGTVGEFTPQSQPLGIQPGNHRVELRADGYHPVEFEAQVVAGQVLPYQGAMQR